MARNPSDTAPGPRPEGPARPPAPEHTGSAASRIVGLLALVGVASTGVLGLFVTKPDVLQGDAARIIYLHVPSAIAMVAAYVLCTVGSVGWLWKKTPGWDALAVSAAEVGIIFTLLTLVTGAVWGKPIWGVYWTWDPRLTTFALVFLLYLGYLTLRRVPADTHSRNKRSAWLAIFAFLNIPIMYKSVDWWRSLHQDATLGLETHIEGMMLFTLFLAMVTSTVVMAWLLIHRFRLTWLEEQIEGEGLEAAIAQRRAEAGLAQ